MAKKELQVSAIENGTVIDHIPADKLFDVIIFDFRYDQEQ